jgi:hypothetical protein
MAFTQHGDIRYIFSFADDDSDAATAAAAIEAATGIAPQELVISGEPEFVAEAEGSDGTVEGLAVAPRKHTFTLNGYLTDKEVFDGVGVTFTHDGRYFIVTGSGLTKAGKDFQKAQMSGVSYPGIPDPASSSEDA